MLQRVKEACEKFSLRNAFHIQGESYTYQQFAGILSAVRAHITKSDSANPLIGVVVYDDIETYSTLYGIMFAGYGFVPLNPKHPVKRNLSVVEQSGVSMVFSSGNDDYVQQLAAESDITLVNTTQLPEVAINLSVPQSKGSDIAYLLFTSGSTSTPKGVPISRYNLDSFIDNFIALGYDIDHTDRFLQIADLTFDLSVVSYMLPLAIGACVYTVPSSGIKYMNIYTLLEDDEITFAIMVPSILSYLRPYFDDIALPKLKYSLFCGEALYADIAEEWMKCMPNGIIINTYGPTEATVLCTYYDMPATQSKAHNGVACIGKAIPNMWVEIANEAGNLLPQGEAGEICLAGSQVTPGYWNNPQKNKEAFFTQQYKGNELVFYRTGDLGFYDEFGFLYYSGRADFQVKIDGYRIELGEIEHHVREFTGLSNVAVVTYTDKIGTTRLQLFVEKYKGTEEDLIAYLRTKIAAYMIPSGVTNLSVFPMNANGKTDRKALQAAI